MLWIRQWTMLEADFLSSFTRDVKKCRKKHWPEELLKEAIKAVLSSDEEDIPYQYNDHGLVGDKKGFRLIHIDGRSSNWILLYQKHENKVVFIRTGTHDEVLK